MDCPGLSPQWRFSPGLSSVITSRLTGARPAGLCGHCLSGGKRSRASGRLSTEAGSHAGYRASRSTGLWELKTSGTGGKLPFPFLGGGFSRLDFVLEHPGLNWLPTEGEKVEFIEGLGVHSNLIPRRIYYGAVRAQKRYFALKLPVAGGDKTVTFAYVDPGRESTGELNSWGAAHGPALGCDPRQGAAGGSDRHRRGNWMRFCGRIGCYSLWAAAKPGKVIEGLTVKQEISAIRGGASQRRPGIYEPVRRDESRGGTVQGTPDTSRSGACGRGLD